ncbi:NADH-ubiquinone oxidoreductase [Smittium culicis]|uniref:NADH-ubiquinone oxidoreductase n=1 Tax=Smittium culicis TaxID=133412 RepID=A0A1R1XIZ1_9FUNG|nr:NADH-ubiquinone oxidoreductase [Smittium culicis]
MGSETGKKVPYPIIDTDPRFTRVVKYCRGIDFLGGVAVAAAGPGLMYWFEKFQPSGNSGAPLRAAMKAAGGIGIIAGFLHMYTQSSMRFLGYKENSREIKKFRKEYAQLKAQGKTMEGLSILTPDLQAVAARYSTNSILNVGILPWFNVVSHPYHGQSEGVIPKEDL